MFRSFFFDVSLKQLKWTEPNAVLEGGTFRKPLFLCNRLKSTENAKNSRKFFCNVNSSFMIARAIRLKAVMRIGAKISTEEEDPDQ